MKLRTSRMWLVYIDAIGTQHRQSWKKLESDGPLIDPETGVRMEIIGWATEDRKPGETYAP